MGKHEIDTIRQRFAICVTAGALVVVSADIQAQAASQDEQSRGALLYSTHCIACHTTEVHWRDRRLATDWTSLAAQVRRWQANSGQNWGDADIAAVARYLNALYYHFPPSPEGKILSDDGSRR